MSALRSLIERLTLWPGRFGLSTDRRAWEGGPMPRTGTGPDFIEALARGLEVITAFEPGREAMSLSDVAAAQWMSRVLSRYSQRSASRASCRA